MQERNLSSAESLYCPLIGHQSHVVAPHLMPPMFQPTSICKCDFPGHGWTRHVYIYKWHIYPLIDNFRIHLSTHNVYVHSKYSILYLHLILYIFTFDTLLLDFPLYFSSFMMDFFAYHWSPFTALWPSGRRRCTPPDASDMHDPLYSSYALP